jgi:phosphoribosylanthranilate isomerase
MTCRVKICGITNVKDALLAIELGADALGFVFYPESPRYITPSMANSIVDQLPPFITPVALFVDAEKSLIDEVVSKNSRWVIQFHGNETESECLQYKVPYIKAIRVKEDTNLHKAADDYASALALLLDTYKKGVPGGTGEIFNWALIPKQLSKPFILAGGLTASNVTLAIKTTKPFAVDVSGGVEESKGIKSKEKIQQFISGVKRG